jgi:hypothetical protein
MIHRKVLLVSALVASALGLGASASLGALDGPGAVRFSFSQTAVPSTGFTFSGPSNELFSSVIDCQWPDGKTSITASAARRVTCFPKGSHFPDVTGNKWFLLDSAIGGAKYPALNGPLTDDLRLVHASSVPGVMSISPVLMQFGDYSGGARPSVIVSQKSVWVYDYVTEKGSEVLRVSTSTGAILQRNAMPAISRPACIVNQYGFWMGQTNDSFFPKDTRLGIWYAPIGHKHGILVRATNDDVFGIRTTGKSVEVEVAKTGGLPPKDDHLWRFTPIRS